MTTESLRLVQAESLAYAQSLAGMKPTEEAFLAQWYTTLKLALNTAQVTLEQLRNDVEVTNTELAAVQYSQSELTILLKSGTLPDGETPLTGTTAVGQLLSPGSSYDESYWTETANLDDLANALLLLSDASLVPDDTISLERLVAEALAGGVDPATLDGDAAAALSALYNFVDEEFLASGWQSGSSTDVEEILSDPVFQARMSTLTSHLSQFLGDTSISKKSTVADLRQSIVGQVNVQLFSQTAMGSELGLTIMQYLGETPQVTTVSEESILLYGSAADTSTFFSGMFATYYDGEDYSVKTLFEKVDVNADDDTSVDQLIARLGTAHESKSSLSTLETLDLKVASQNYSNHLSLLTKMVSDRLTDVQSLLRDW